MSMKKLFMTTTLMFSFFLCTSFSQQVKQVTGERELPDFYTPGANLDVLLNINIAENNPPNGLIITETPPSGWSILTSQPAFTSVVGGTYKWLFYGGTVQDTVITYTVNVPSTSSGQQTFNGKMQYNDGTGNPVDDETTGDTSILTATPCRMAVSPDSLNFGTTETSLPFTITNIGGPNLEWNASTTQSWLTITKTNGVLSGGASEIITANVNRAFLASGTYRGNINCTSNGGNSTILVLMIVGSLTPVESFNAYPVFGGIFLTWENPENYTGTIIFRRIGIPMTSNPQNGICYDIPGNTEGYPSTVGGGICIWKDHSGLDYFFDEIDTSDMVYYRIYSYLGINYSTELQASSRPSTVLYIGTINNFSPDYICQVSGTGTLLDGFEVIIPGNSLTGTLPADIDFGVIEPELAPLHPGLKGFANIYGISIENTEILPGKNIKVKVPVYQTDLDGTGVQKIQNLNLYQWNSDTTLWEKVTITEVEETDLDAPIGYITAEVTSFGKINYFALGTEIIPPSGGDSGCFIATAVYGTEMAKEVIALKRFRDNHLMNNRAGQAFVRWYYRHSPPVANFIRDKKLLKATVRVGLRPLLWLANHL